MTYKYMLDTNICIYTIRHKAVKVISKIKENINDGICISSITYAELKHGVYNSNPIANVEKNANNLAVFVQNINVVPFDDACADEYGKICTYLSRSGQIIGDFDMLISAHAKTLGCIAVTNNVREFERVPGLTIENWAE